MTDETLRQRVERVYRFEAMAHPLAMDLAQPDVAAKMPNLTPGDQILLAWFMASALRTALFDLAEQLDGLLGGQIEAE